VVTALGPVFGKLPEGGFGYFDGMTSEKVDAAGVANVAAAAKAMLPPSVRQEKLVRNKRSLACPHPLNDEVSESGSKRTSDGRGAGLSGRNELKR
jgi:hypothetical protein